MKLTCFLLLCGIISSCYLCCDALTVNNVCTGVYSTRRESTGLYLSSTSTFKPIVALSTRIHVTTKATLFVHYQLAFYDRSCDFKSILQVNSFNAGSMVHIGNQQDYKTATGYYMAYINPGYYNMEVHYTASSSISQSSSSDYQTAVINVMWFENVNMASDGIKCYPTPKINYNNILSPIKDLETNLYAPWNGIILAAYQFSVYTSSSSRYMMARMNVNDQQLKSTTMINQGYYIDFSGLWMKYQYDGEYHFGITYRNTYSRTYFEDCRNSYKDNKNLYAIVLPSRCRVVCNIEPTSTWSYSYSSWKNTDISCSFSLYQDTHLLVRYQYTSTGRNTYTKMCLAINGATQPHTATVRGNTGYAGNTGFWQGVLSSGSYTVTLQQSSGSSYTHYVYGSSYEQYTRAMDVVKCS